MEIKIKCSESNNNKLPSSILRFDCIKYSWTTVYLLYSFSYSFVYSQTGQWLISPRSNVKFKKNPFAWIKLKMNINPLPQIDFNINAQKSSTAWDCMPLDRNSIHLLKNKRFHIIWTILYKHIIYAILGKRSEKFEM